MIGSWNFFGLQRNSACFKPVISDIGAGLHSPLPFVPKFTYLEHAGYVGLSNDGGLFSYGFPDVEGVHCVSHILGGAT